MEKKQDSHREGVCPLCHTTVAPYAPERMVLGKEVVHKHCFNGLSNWAQARLLQATGADPATGLK